MNNKKPVSPISRKKSHQIIDSRHLKILASKKSDLKNSVVFVCLDHEKYGHLDKTQVNSILKEIDNIEPGGFYFPMFKKIRIEMFDRADIKNRDLLITIEHEESLQKVDTREVENDIKKALSDAKSVNFVHRKIQMERL